MDSICTSKGSFLVIKRCYEVSHLHLLESAQLSHRPAPLLVAALLRPPQRHISARSKVLLLARLLSGLLTEEIFRRRVDLLNKAWKLPRPCKP